MAKAEAIAEVFWRAFLSLSGAEKRAVVERLLQDPRFREDLWSSSWVAEAFWQTFQTRSAKGKRAVIEALLRDPRLREDLLDISLILARQGEPSRPYEEFAEELHREGRL